VLVASFMTMRLSINNDAQISGPVYTTIRETDLPRIPVVLILD